MPYNNAPIGPQEELTGTSVLPLARVKKIIAQDDDIAQCSNSAAFAISVATEMFVRAITEQAHNVAKSERKPRRNIQYKDLATAVARIDNLEFLADVIPRTTTFKQFKEKKAREAANTASMVETGQTTLDKQPASDHHSGGFMQQQPHTNGTNGYQPAEDHLPPRSPPMAPTQDQLPSSHGSPMVDRTMPGIHAHPQPEDVQMSG